MQHNNKTLYQASLLIAISGILYGFLGYLGTSVLRENVSISTMLFLRFFIAGCWMLLFSIKKHLSQPFAIDKKILLYMFVIGAIGYAGSSGFYFVATQYIGTGLAMVIFFSYPIFIALSDLVISRQIKLKIFLTLIVMTIGLIMLQSSANHTFNLIGVMYCLLSAASYAFYIVGSKRFASYKLDPTLLTIIVCFACAAIFLIFSLSTHTFSLPHSVSAWTHLFALGIFATALPIQLVLEGLKHVSSMRASIISVLEPLVTVFVGILLLHESVTAMQMLGALIIMTSAVLVQFQKEL